MNHLTTLMRSRVSDECPDLAALLDGAVREGRSLQRRRRIRYAGVCVAAAAVVAGAAIGATSLSAGNSATELTPATGNATTPSPATPGSSETPGLKAGQTFDLGHRIVGTVVACAAGEADPVGGNPACILPSEFAIQQWSSIPGSGTGFAIVLTGPVNAIQNFWSNGFQDPQLARYQGLAFALSADNPLIQPIYHGQDVAIHVAGWQQVGPVGDGKQSLEGPHGAVAGIVWRAASDYAAWLAGEKNDPSTWTSTVHDGVFVTIQGGRGTTNADIQALGHSLTWK